MTTIDTILATIDISSTEERGIAADALDDLGRYEEAELLRSSAQVWVNNDGIIVRDTSLEAANRFLAAAAVSWDSADPWLATDSDGLSDEDEDSLRQMCDEADCDYDAAKDVVLAAVKAKVDEMPHTFVASDGVSEETLDAEDMDDAVSEAEDWCRGGDWGKDGARIEVTVTEEDARGDTVESRHISVDIEPDHAAMILGVCGGRHDDRYERCCGDDPDDHDWTSEGEGGCDQNPGVWSTGGTSMSFASHCRTCGLHRSEHTTGSQRNPGEHDTVAYEMPEAWCKECEAEECEAERRLERLGNCTSAHDYASLLDDCLEECGTVHDRSESGASVYRVVADGVDLVRVADGVASEWFGGAEECREAIKATWHAKTWQDGWDGLGDGVDEPEDYETI